MKFTPGKLAGMKAVSDSRGVIAAAAMDQRGSLQKSIAKARGGEAGAEDLSAFKTAVTAVLTPHATAICPTRPSASWCRKGAPDLKRAGRPGRGWN